MDKLISYHCSCSLAGFTSWSL